jgi:hypothetical protein
MSNVTSSTSANAAAAATPSAKSWGVPDSWIKADVEDYFQKNGTSNTIDPSRIPPRGPQDPQDFTWTQQTDPNTRTAMRRGSELYVTVTPPSSGLPSLSYDAGPYPPGPPAPRPLNALGTVQPGNPIQTVSAGKDGLGQAKQSTEVDFYPFPLTGSEGANTIFRVYVEKEVLAKQIPGYNPATAQVFARYPKNDSAGTDARGWVEVPLTNNNAREGTADSPWIFNSEGFTLSDKQLEPIQKFGVAFYVRQDGRTYPLQDVRHNTPVTTIDPTGNQAALQPSSSRRSWLG